MYPWVKRFQRGDDLYEGYNYHPKKEADKDYLGQDVTLQQVAGQPALASLTHPTGNGLEKLVGGSTWGGSSQFNLLRRSQQGCSQHAYKSCKLHQVIGGLCFT